MGDWPGVEARSSREALLRDLASASDTWADWVMRVCDGDDVADGTDVSVLASLDVGQRQALAAVARQALEGLVHSALVVLDGGALRCPTLDLRDPDGRSLGVALHEQWPDFAPGEQRLTRGLAALG